MGKSRNPTKRHQPQQQPPTVVFIRPIPRHQQDPDLPLRHPLRHRRDNKIDSLRRLRLHRYPNTTHPLRPLWPMGPQPNNPQPIRQQRNAHSRRRHQRIRVLRLYPPRPIHIQIQQHQRRLGRHLQRHPLPTSHLHLRNPLHNNPRPKILANKKRHSNPPPLTPVTHHPH